MDGTHRPPPADAAASAARWTRDANSNVVRLRPAKPATPLPLGRCASHEAALAEERTRPRP